MEEKNIMTEMEQMHEQMRQQMQVLREKLDKQEIVNDKLVKNSVRSKMSWIKKYVYFEFVTLPIVALMWFGIKVTFDLSWFNYAITMVMCTIDAVWDYRINIASLKIDKVESNSLTDTLQKLVTMKQMRAKSFSIMLPLLLLWLMWTCFETWQYVSTITFEEDFIAAYGGLAGGVIGFFIGLFAAFCIYRMMQNTNDELIAQINEFTNND